MQSKVPYQFYTNPSKTTLQKPISKSLTPTTFLPLWTTIIDDNIVKDENQQNLSQCKI
jgi:hypothetical protein